MFTLWDTGRSCAAVYDRWLLTDRCMSSGRSSSGAGQPTTSCQSAQCTKPICCPGNRYFSSTFQQDQIKYWSRHLKGSLKMFPFFTAFILLVSHIHSSSFSLWSSVCFLLTFFSVSSPFFSLWMFGSAEVEREEKTGGWRKTERRGC